MLIGVSVSPNNFSHSAGVKNDAKVSEAVFKKEFLFIVYRLGDKLESVLIPNRNQIIAIPKVSKIWLILNYENKLRNYD